MAAHRPYADVLGAPAAAPPPSDADGIVRYLPFVPMLCLPIVVICIYMHSVQDSVALTEQQAVEHAAWWAEAHAAGDEARWDELPVVQHVETFAAQTKEAWMGWVSRIEIGESEVQIAVGGICVMVWIIGGWYFYTEHMHDKKRRERRERENALPEDEEVVHGGQQHARAAAAAAAGATIRRRGAGAGSGRWG